MGYAITVTVTVVALDTIALIYRVIGIKLKDLSAIGVTAAAEEPAEHTVLPYHLALIAHLAAQIGRILRPGLSAAVRKQADARQEHHHTRENGYHHQHTHQTYQ